jgi:hypothetical protein
MAASARSDERLPHVAERTVLIQQAFRLEWLTVAWMVIEALVAIGSGVIAGSLTLTAFGLDSVIELISANVLIWRLNEELRCGREFSRDAEGIASRSGSALLFALAAYRTRRRLEPLDTPRRRVLRSRPRHRRRGHAGHVRARTPKGQRGPSARQPSDACRCY